MSIAPVPHQRAEVPGGVEWNLGESVDGLLSILPQYPCTMHEWSTLRNAADAVDAKPKPGYEL